MIAVNPEQEIEIIGIGIKDCNKLLTHIEKELPYRKTEIKTAMSDLVFILAKLKRKLPGINYKIRVLMLTVDLTALCLRISKLMNQYEHNADYKDRIKLIYSTSQLLYEELKKESK